MNAVPLTYAINETVEKRAHYQSSQKPVSVIIWTQSKKFLQIYNFNEASNIFILSVYKTKEIPYGGDKKMKSIGCLYVDRLALM